MPDLVAFWSTLALFQEAGAPGSELLSSPGTIAAVASILTALLIKLMDLWSARQRNTIDDATAIRAELRQAERDLRDRLERAERRIDRYRARCVALESEVAAYTAHAAYLTTLLQQHGIQPELKMPVSRIVEFDVDEDDDEDDEDDGTDARPRRRGYP